MTDIRRRINMAVARFVKMWNIWAVKVLHLATTTDEAVRIKRMLNPHIRLRGMVDDGRCQEGDQWSK